MTEKQNRVVDSGLFFFDFPQYAQASDRAVIERAWNYIQEQRGTQPTEKTAHPMRVARILAELRLDRDSIITALLHGKPDERPFNLDDVEREFGVQIAALLKSTEKISEIKVYNKQAQASSAVCKMFFSMVDDLRVMIIRLADRLDKMRSITNYNSARQKLIARETVEIWAPLAQRLGISQLEYELEDLSLKILHRDIFDQIKGVVSAKKNERAEFLHRAEKEILTVTRNAGLAVAVYSRAKHFWSIYQKMKVRNKPVDEIYDLLAVRILCESDNDCYTILGLVHTIWKPLEGRFKDYIAMPKANGYQSLHTSVMCFEGRTLEIQIRTHAMHEVAERGIASHWLYKDTDKRKQKTEQELSFVRQLRELSHGEFDSDEFLAELKTDLLGDSIYVFTPKGDIIELPSGANAIDFAYAIHSAVGEKLVSAKADGVIIALSKPLKNTQVVEVATHPHAHPTRNQYALARTARARQKIRSWLAAHEELPAAPVKNIEKKKNEARHPRKQRLTAEEAALNASPFSAVLKIRVGDAKNFLVTFAQCCTPVPPVPIIGYVSRGRGIIIHRKNCSNLAKIPEIEDRHIDVDWDTSEENL